MLSQKADLPELGQRVWVLGSKHHRKAWGQIGGLENKKMEDASKHCVELVTEIMEKVTS